MATTYNRKEMMIVPRPQPDLASRFRIFDPATARGWRRPRGERLAARDATHPAQPDPRPAAVVASRPVACEQSSTARAVPGELPAGIERQILDVLGRPVISETIEAAFRRKEAELATLFGGLAVHVARGLYHRLTTVHSEDDLANQFGRLVAERRSRLLALLAGARCRELGTRGGNEGNGTW